MIHFKAMKRKSTPTKSYREFPVSERGKILGRMEYISEWYFESYWQVGVNVMHTLQCLEYNLAQKWLVILEEVIIVR